MHRVTAQTRRSLAVTVRASTSLARRLQLTAQMVWMLLAAAVALLGAVLLVGGLTEDVSQHNGAATADPQRLRLFVEHRPHWLVSAARAVTALGAVPVLGLVAVLAAGLLWWRGQRLVVALAPGIALGCSGVVVAVVKQAVGRARPDLAVRLVADSEASFPSGHSADSAALFVTLAVVLAVVVLRRPLARALTVGAAFLASGLVGLSRLVLAAHWPTDVAAGWALGLAIAIGVGTAAGLLARMAPPSLDQAHRTRARVVNLVLARRPGFEPRPFAA